MTSHLREALAELAEEARPYLRAGDVIAADRRRRRRRAAVAVPAVAVAVSAVLVATGVVAGPAGTAPPDAAVRPTPIDGTPHTGVPRLPATGAVGVASYVYSVLTTDCQRECPAYLVRPDGARYLLEPSPRGGSTGGTALSPDGRWLGQRRADGYTVRDLTGTTVFQFGPSVDAWVWSPDSRWLLLADHRDGDVDRYIRLDLRDGTRVDPVDPPGDPVVGIRPDGLLVLGRALAEPEPFVLLEVVDPVSGEYQDRRTVVPELKPGETLWSVGGAQVFLTPGGSTALVTVFSSGADPRPVGILEADYTDKSGMTRVTTRYDPLVATGANAGWEVRGALPDVGILATTWNGGATRLVAIHGVSGEPRVLAELPANSQLVVRGAARY